MSKLGGELDEEKQLNKSLRENQEEWQVPQKKNSIINLLAFFSDFWLAPGLTLVPQTRLKRAEVEAAVLQQKKDREIVELQEQVMRLSFNYCCLWEGEIQFETVYVLVPWNTSLWPHEGERLDVLHGGTVSSQGVAFEGWDTRGQVVGQYFLYILILVCLICCNMHVKTGFILYKYGFQHNCWRGTTNKTSKGSKKGQEVKLSVALGFLLSDQKIVVE